MKVILRERIPNLGDVGEIKEVADGYARNYLFPRNLAYPVTKGIAKKVMEEQRCRERRQEKEHRMKLELAQRLKDVSLTFPVKVSSEEQLYGSVSERDIVKLLAAEYQIEIEEKAVRLEEPIKRLGVYRIPIHLGSGIESAITVWVVKSDGQHHS